MHLSVMQGLAWFPSLLSLLRCCERPIQSKVTLNQSCQEGLKTGKPFFARPDLSQPSALTHPYTFTPDNSVYPKKTRHKRKGKRDESQEDSD